MVWQMRPWPSAGGERRAFRCVRVRAKVTSASQAGQNEELINELCVRTRKALPQAPPVTIF
jgi:hypothetical protein